MPVVERPYRQSVRHAPGTILLGSRWADVQNRGIVLGKLQDIGEWVVCRPPSSTLLLGNRENSASGREQLRFVEDEKEEKYRSISFT